MPSTYGALLDTVLYLMAKEARSLAAPNPFPEQEPVLGGKAQAGPASCRDVLMRLYLLLHGNSRSKIPAGKTRLSGRVQEALVTWLCPFCVSRHQLKPSTGDRRCRKEGLGNRKTGSVVCKVLCA